MIDFTTTQSRQYSELIERPGVTQTEIDYQAMQILRGLSTLDMSEALYDSLDAIKDLLLLCEDKRIIGHIVDNAIWSYCQRVAQRELEA